jgi:hypothetical protein
MQGIRQFSSSQRSLHNQPTFTAYPCVERAWLEIVTIKDQYKGRPHAAEIGLACSGHGAATPLIL